MRNFKTIIESWGQNIDMIRFRKTEENQHFWLVWRFWLLWFCLVYFFAESR